MLAHSCICMCMSVCTFVRFLTSCMCHSHPCTALYMHNYVLLYAQTPKLEPLGEKDKDRTFKDNLFLLCGFRTALPVSMEITVA